MPDFASTSSGLPASGCIMAVMFSSPCMSALVVLGCCCWCAPLNENDCTNRTSPRMRLNAECAVTSCAMDDGSIKSPRLGV